ncbi:MAG: RhoGEF domain-containing protein, partial [archaeon]|nr:RhoGEF domain-containing protein [archaeon]
MKGFLTTRIRSMSTSFLPERRRSQSHSTEETVHSLSLVTADTRPGGVCPPEVACGSSSESSCGVPSAGSHSSSSNDFPDTPAGDTQAASIRRHRVMVELLSSEANYADSLRKMIVYYKEPLATILSEVESSSIFSVADLLADFHASLLDGLKQLLEAWTPHILIGGFLVERVSFLRCYSAYVNNYSVTINTLAACEQRSSFRARMEELSSAIPEDGRQLQSLYSYLIMPIQRIPRYLLLLQELGACTLPDHADTPHLQKTIVVIGEKLSVSVFICA